MSTPQVPTTPAPHPSWALLSERVAELPTAITRACHAQMPAGLAKLVAEPELPVIATGGGLSEGPARLLVALLQRAGRRAQFVSQSGFAVGYRGDRRALLVSFSQGLAPNARLPLEPVNAFRKILLVTSVRPAVGVPPSASSLAHLLTESDQLVWTLPPQSEDRLLLRVIGPAVAQVAALRVADALAPGCLREASFEGLGALAARALTTPSHALDLFGGLRRPIALVPAPVLTDLVMPLRWKLLEGLRIGDPPVWDPLQFAHGPLQAIFEERCSLVFLRTATDGADDLYARLREVLARSGDPSRHPIVELRSSLPAPLALVELDAMLDAALLATLAQHPLALDDWPSRGQDGALYDLGAEVGRSP